MKNVLVIFALMFLVSGYALASSTEYRVTRVQAPITLPDGRNWNGDTVTGSLVNVRSQAFVTPGKFRLKMELCGIHYEPACRDIYLDYTFLGLNGSNLAVRDSFGRTFNVQIVRENPLQIILPGNVNVQFKQVGYSGQDRHPDITKKWNIDEALRDIETGSEFFFPSF